MKTKSGLALALTAAVISGFAVYINSLGVRAWGSAYGGAAAYTTAKNLVAALALAIALAVAGRWQPRETMVMVVPRRAAQWAGLGAIAVVGGSVPFVLFFTGLARVSSGNAAFIQKTLVIWVALLAVPLLRERLSPWHLGAIGVLVWGQAVLGGGIRGIGLGVGEAMILAATLLWAAETVIARWLLRGGLPTLTAATARMGGGVAILIGYTLATTKWADLTATGWHQWSWAIATGLILAAYVATWYSALARASAIDVTALLIPGAIITALLQSGTNALAPQWPGLALIAAGTVLAFVAARYPGRRRSGPAQAGAR
jgi:drug/metabolite transporter (DMT)-like permease